MVTGFLAFLLILVGTGDRRKAVNVAVASHDIAPGQSVTASDLQRVAIPADSPLLPFLLGVGIAPDAGLVAAHRIVAGSPIAKADLVPAAAAGGLRSMSLPVPAERAVGGDLTVGDRIDVIDSSADPAVYVATGLEVLSVSSTTAGALGSAGPNHVTVSVDADGALALAGALARGKVDLVRSTGSAAITPPASTPTTRPTGAKAGKATP